MDMITLAIVGALAKLSETIIADAYQALKAVIVMKWGVDSDLSKAVKEVEKKPNSLGRQETLKEEVAAAKADQDPDLLKAAEVLLSKLKNQPDRELNLNQNVTGDRNIFS